MMIPSVKPRFSVCVAPDYCANYPDGAALHCYRSPIPGPEAPFALCKWKSHNPYTLERQGSTRGRFMAVVPATDVSSRIERLPFSAWHARVAALIGAAGFFDAFDALAIAFVLPVISGLWALKAQQIGLIIDR